MKNYRKVIQENTDKEDGAGVHSFPMTSMSTKSPEKVTVLVFMRVCRI